METIPAPYERSNLVGRESVENDLRQSLERAELNHGWIIKAPKGAGKATLAYSIARAVLAPHLLQDNHSLAIDPTSQAFRLIAQQSHPDLFIAERKLNEKTNKLQSEITVDTIRSLINFMNMTPAMGKARVAIIDTADDLNRNGANALLKVLEEPPKDGLILLLSESPARLLPTIRSRCRTLSLREVERSSIIDLILNESGVDQDEATRIAEMADGKPGFALTLANGGGADAMVLADRFLQSAIKNTSLDTIIAKLTAKDSDDLWALFKLFVCEQLSSASRKAARGVQGKPLFAEMTADTLLNGWEILNSFFARADALNLDRRQIITAAAYDLRQTFSRMT